MLDSIDPQQVSMPAHTPRQAALLTALQAHQGELPASVDNPLAAPHGAPRLRTWHLSIRFASELLSNGFDPAAFIRYLARLGDILSLQTLTWAVPELDSLDPEACYLGFEVSLHSDASREQLEDVFALVQDFCTLRLQAQEPTDTALPAEPAHRRKRWRLQPPHPCHRCPPASRALPPAARSRWLRKSSTI
ncbi:hypothetical protein NWF32_04785 [Pseudomonas qingdaonensis]|nr:hypothetical protein [Pseudomonas qingdaonensis]